ncbi:MAG: sugar transferase [Lachnospiraceae bacterium]|nr:sugar transferase [Lachnospiraceae bacterium]
MNKSNIGASTNFIQIIVDIVVSLIAFVTVYFLVHEDFYTEQLSRCFVLYVVFMFIYILDNKDRRVYNITTFFYMDRIFKQVTKSFVLSSIIIASLLYYVADGEFDKVFFSVFIVVAYIMLLVSTFIFRYISKIKMVDFYPRTAYVGEIRQFEKFNYFMKKTNIGINFVGYIRVDTRANDNYLGNVRELEKIIKEHSIDQIYIMQTKRGKTDMQKYIDLCMEMGVTVRMVMDFYKDGVAKSYMSSVGTYPIVTFHTVSLNNTEKVVKRVVDIVGSIVGIVLFSPVMIVTAVLVKCTSKGPIIFKQRRVGMNGRVFNMYKFRSMYVDAEERKKELMQNNEMESDLMFKMKDDPRVTKVGKVIRKLSIDELPQFFNVFIGDMSLVGTRPPTEEEVSKYSSHHWRRISIKPGITGMWQISGRSAITNFDQIVDLDTKYIDEWSVAMDFKVMAKTVGVLVRRSGAY